MKVASLRLGGRWESLGTGGPNTCMYTDRCWSLATGMVTRQRTLNWPTWGNQHYFFACLLARNTLLCHNLMSDQLATNYCDFLTRECAVVAGQSVSWSGTPAFDGSSSHAKQLTFVYETSMIIMCKYPGTSLIFNWADANVGILHNNIAVIRQV